MNSDDKKKCDKSFCVLPWIHSFVNLGGHYQVCCTGEEFNNFIRDENGEKFNIVDKPSLDSIMNSQYMKDFRLKLLSGELPRECMRCKITENSGGVSRRQIENNEYAQIADDLISQTNEDGQIEFRTLHADYRLGNVCNLQCRMCNPRASRKWVNVYSYLSDELKQDNFTNNFDEYRKDPWLDSGYYLTEFKQKLSTLERLHFGGGEPLYNPHMNKVLRACVDEGRAKDIVLSYNTNLTILSNETLSLWKEFKEIKLLVSIDAYGELNNYIRYPSKWSDIDKNLKFLDENNKEFNISEIIVSTTVQVNNLVHLDKLFQYLEGFKFVKKCPNLIMLYFPSYLSPLVMPKKLLTIGFLKLQTLVHKLKEQSDIEDYMIQNMEQMMSLIASILKKDQYGFSEFVKFTREYDQNNSLDITLVNPEMKNFIDNHK